MTKHQIRYQSVFSILFFSAILLSLITGAGFLSLNITFHEEELHVSDSNITENARHLYFNLADLTDQVLFGQQDTNFYGLNATDMSLWSDWENLTNSDVLTLTGSYPALYGFDIFTSANYTVPGIKAAFERGGVITVSWHALNFVTGGSFYDTSGDVVSKILPGGSHHANFTAMLDDIALNLGNLEHFGEEIPIIFRPWHEQNGDWFWWCSPKYCSKQEFISLYRFTVEYLRDTKGVHNFLYAFSPNQKLVPFTTSNYLACYPGDDVVDILALDAYDYGFPTWKNNVAYSLKTIIQISMQKGKIVAFSETGLGAGLSETNVADWYSTILLDLLNFKGIRNIAYLMVWRNANYGHYWVPYPGHPQAEGFMEFFNSNYTIFGNNLPNLYLENTFANNYELAQQTIRNLSIFISFGGLIVVSALILVFGYHLVLEIKSRPHHFQN